MAGAAPLRSEAAHYRQHTLSVDAASSGTPRGSAQKHFHTDAPTGAAV